MEVENLSVHCVLLSMALSANDVSVMSVCHFWLSEYSGAVILNIPP